MIGQKYALFRKQPNFCSRKWITSQGDTRVNAEPTTDRSHLSPGISFMVFTLLPFLSRNSTDWTYSGLSIQKVA